MAPKLTPEEERLWRFARALQHPEHLHRLSFIEVIHERLTPDGRVERSRSVGLASLLDPSPNWLQAISKDSI